MRNAAGPAKSESAISVGGGARLGDYRIWSQKGTSLGKKNTYLAGGAIDLGHGHLHSHQSIVQLGHGVFSGRSVRNNDNMHGVVGSSSDALVQPYKIEEER